MDRQQNYSQESNTPQMHHTTRELNPGHHNNKTPHRIKDPKNFDLEIDFEEKFENIPMFIHGLSPDTKPEELREYLSNRCLFSSLIFKKKRTSNKNKQNLYQSIASFVVRDRQTAYDLVKRSGILKGRIVHCDVKYSSSKKMKAYQERRLFLRNLKPSWTDEKIFSNLARYGRVRAAYCVKKVKDGKSKGYGFADFFTKNEAQRFLDNAGNIKIEGEEVIVQGYNKERGSKQGSGGSSNDGKKAKSGGAKNKKSSKNSKEAKRSKFSLVEDNFQIPTSTKFSHGKSLNEMGQLPSHAQYRSEKMQSSSNEDSGKNKKTFFSKMGSNSSSNNQGSFDEKREMNLRLIGLALMNENLFAVSSKERTIVSALSQAVKVNDFQNQISNNYVLNSYDHGPDFLIKIIAELGGQNYKIRPLNRKLPGLKKRDFKKKTVSKEAFMTSKYSHRRSRVDSGWKAVSPNKNVGKNTLKNRKRRQRKKRKQREQREIKEFEDNSSSNIAMGNRKSPIFFKDGDFNSRTEHFDGHYSSKHIDRAHSIQFFESNVRGSRSPLIGRKPSKKSGGNVRRRWSHEE